jgi:hypothetical protein
VASDVLTSDLSPAVIQAAAQALKKMAVVSQFRSWNYYDTDDIATAALAAAAPLIRAQALEEAAKAIEAEPNSHFVKVKTYCMPYCEDDQPAEWGSCGDHPCSGHDDGYSAIHGSKHYSRLVRGLVEDEQKTANELAISAGQEDN